MPPKRPVPPPGHRTSHHARAGMPAPRVVQRKDRDELRARLERLEAERQQQANAHAHLQHLVTEFRHRSTIAHEAVAQASAIRALVDRASLTPSTDMDSSDSEAELRDDEIARARNAIDVSHADGEASGLAVAAALVERQEAREARRRGTGRSNGTSKNADGGSDPTDELDEEAAELMQAVSAQEESRNIQVMVAKFQTKERPIPPKFDSTCLSIEMDTLVRQYAEIILSTETMLRAIMDPSGKSFQVNIFDGELARTQYHQEVVNEWLPVSKEHAGKFSKGAMAITSGVTGQVTHARKATLEAKEECDLLTRQCERKKIECDVTARRQESLMTSTVVRQVMGAGWSRRDLPPAVTAANANQPDSDTSANVTAETLPDAAVSTRMRSSRRHDPEPTIPRRYVRSAALRLRHHLTSLQSAIVRGSSPGSVERDQAALKAAGSIIDRLKAYETAHRDEAVQQSDPNAEVREQLNAIAITASIDISQAHFGASGVHSAASPDTPDGAADLAKVETIAASALKNLENIDRSRTPTPDDSASDASWSPRRA